MIRLAVVGATGLVGQTVRNILEEKQLPIDEYIFFASKKSAHNSIRFLNKEYLIQALDENSFSTKIDYAIFCAGGEVSKKYAPSALDSPCFC